MQLARFRWKGTTHIGALDGDTIRGIDTSDTGPTAPIVSAAMSDSVALMEGEHPLSEVSLLSPLQRPGKIVCLGLNYRDHAAEGGYDIPESPLLFAKATSAVIGPGDDIVRPTAIDQLDYEAELAIIIGKQATNVGAAVADEYIAGYTAFNDVTARDVQYAFSQFFRGKSFDTFAPLGPALVTTDSLDPSALSIRTWVNEELRQESSTSEMIFDVPTVIESVSQTMTLFPGDVIATGTPPGVGIHRDPPELLGVGDEVTVEVEGVGTLQNTVVAEDAPIDQDA